MRTCLQFGSDQLLVILQTGTASGTRPRHERNGRWIKPSPVPIRTGRWRRRQRRRRRRRRGIPAETLSIREARCPKKLKRVVGHRLGSSAQGSMSGGTEVVTHLHAEHNRQANKPTSDVEVPTVLEGRRIGQSGTSGRCVGPEHLPYNFCLKTS